MTKNTTTCLQFWTQYTIVWHVLYNFPRTNTACQVESHWATQTIQGDTHRGDLCHWWFVTHTACRVESHWATCVEYLRLTHQGDRCRWWYSTVPRSHRPTQRQCRRPWMVTGPVQSWWRRVPNLWLLAVGHPTRIRPGLSMLSSPEMRLCVSSKELEFASWGSWPWYATAKTEMENDAWTWTDTTTNN